MGAAVWHPMGFTHNSDPLLQADVAREFLGAAGATAGQTAAVVGAFLGGWHAGRRPAQHEGFCAQGQR